MTQKHRVASVAFLVLVLAVSAHYFLPRSADEQQAERRRIDGSFGVANETSLDNYRKPAENVKQNSPVSGASGSKDEDSNLGLYRAYRSATNLRVFVERAKLEPQAGGLLYANDALLFCKLLRPELDGDKLPALRAKVASSGESSTRLGALERLAASCQDFTDQELGDDDRRFRIDQGVQNDPLMAIKRRAHQLDRTAPGSAAKLLEDILNSRDPLLLEGARGVGSGLDKDGLPVGYVDGVAYGGLDAERFIYAWDLAICGISGGCGPHDNRLVLECALAGKCYESMEAKVRSEVGSDELLAATIKVAARLQQIIEARDARALMSR